VKIRIATNRHKSKYPFPPDQNTTAKTVEAITPIRLAGCAIPRRGFGANGPTETMPGPREIRVTVSQGQYERLSKAKNGRSWRKAILEEFGVREEVDH